MRNSYSACRKAGKPGTTTAAGQAADEVGRCSCAVATVEQQPLSSPGHLVKRQRQACLGCCVAAVHCWQQLITQLEQCAAEGATQLSKVTKQLQCSMKSDEYQHKMLSRWLGTSVVQLKWQMHNRITRSSRNTLMAFGLTVFLLTHGVA
jgi:hypothetical protein